MASDKKIKINPIERKGGNGKRSNGFVSFPMFGGGFHERVQMLKSYNCLQLKLKFITSETMKLYSN